jgi:hypothetical protein
MKKAFIIIIVFVLGFISSTYINKTRKATSFTGTITGYEHPLADSPIYLILDENIKIMLYSGYGPPPLAKGKVTGTATGDIRPVEVDIEGGLAVGDKVSVRAKHILENNYSLLGSARYYIKVIDSE